MPNNADSRAKRRQQQSNRNASASNNSATNDKGTEVHKAKKSRNEQEKLKAQPAKVTGQQQRIEFLDSSGEDDSEETKQRLNQGQCFSMLIE